MSNESATDRWRICFKFFLIKKTNSQQVANFVIHPFLCLRDLIVWKTSEGDSLHKFIFDASVLLQSISHLILVLSQVDEPVLCPGLMADKRKALPSSDKLFISLSCFVFNLNQRESLLAYFDPGHLVLMSYFNPEQQM